jgi:hypothetical protein
MATRAILFTLAGAAAGYGWHRLAGCSTGACPLTASPLVSALWGAAVGLLAAMGR